MPLVPLRSREDPLAPGEGAAPLDTRAILTAAGEVAYAWTLASDALTLDLNAFAVLGAAMAAATTGRSFAALLDPQNRTSRNEAILGARASDDGAGVAYDIEYTVLPEGSRGRRLIIEDVGRWYADGEGRPVRAEGVMRVINERHEREQRLQFLSRYDELTGYLNRAALLATLGDAIAGAAKAGGALAFMIIAIDNFRAINDAYGFDVADQVLAGVAQRIKASLRDGDTLGRFAGNKLGVVLRNCDVPDMPAAAERLQSVVRGDVIVTAAGSVAVTASLGGVALPRHGRNVSEAVTRAQEALHIARLGGHGRFAGFALSPERNERRRANAALSNDLVAALADNRFLLGYQPVVETRTRELAFSEGLLRIRRPQSVEIAAADFVTLAERLGLIRLLDERTLDLATAALGKAPEARLSVNVSGETVGDPVWLASLAKRLENQPGLAGRLIVEITETALFANADEATRFVATLHDLGCQVAIDDFGAGYSSFKSLRDLKVDIVKIDGSYVENLARSRDDQAFVRALVELARSLEVKIVAERVQDEDVAGWLAAWGVDYLQGHLIGDAATADLPPVPSGFANTP
jgi:diguanylate cyclase (GGDEF)-like protein